MVIRDGKVAIQHRNSNPAFVEIADTGRSYSFTPRNNVSLAWVDEQDVDRLLAVRMKTCECAGGAYTNKFFVATEINVCIHETGTRCK